jgi:hypothetical protein
MATTEPRQRTAGILSTTIQVLVLVLLLAVLAAVVQLLLLVTSVANVPSQVSGATSQASRIVSSAQQAVQDATDPNHPPAGLTYDTEFTAIDTWRVGDGLPGGTDYVLTVRAIQRRSGAGSSDTALFATIHAELRQPHETRILGQLVRSDSDPHDYVVYKGELFRISNTAYRVNWLSQETDSVAAGVVRNPDAVTQPLKFDYP